VAGETLRDGSGLLANFPDNTAGLIDAVNSRDFVVSVAPGVGFVEDDPATVPYTIPMTDGVPVDFMASLTTPLFVGNFWKLDGNNAFVPSYTDIGVIVPAGLFRLLEGSVILNVEKVGATQTYQFQGTEGGVFTGDPLLRDIGSNPEVVVFNGVRTYEVQPANPISFTITPVGHSQDLIVNDVRVSLVGSMI